MFVVVVVGGGGGGGGGGGVAVVAVELSKLMEASWRVDRSKPLVVF